MARRAYHVKTVFFRAYRFLALWVSGLFLGAALLGCDNAHDDHPIVIGVAAFVGNEPLFWAESDEAYPRDLVHIVETPVDFSLLQAFRGQTIDAASVSLSRAIAWGEQELDSTVVAAVSASDGLDVIIAQKTIRTPADLSGRRIGYEFETVNEYLVERALSLNGLSIDDVTPVDIANHELGDALKTGRVDAISGFGGAIKRLSDQAAFHQIFSSSEIPNELLDVLVVNSAFLDDHPIQVDAMIEGLLLSQERFNARSGNDPLPKGSISTITKVADIQGLRYPGLEDQKIFFANDGAVLRALIEKRRQSISKPLSSNATPLRIDTRPINRVLARLAGRR